MRHNSSISNRNLAKGTDEDRIASAGAYGYEPDTTHGAPAQPSAFPGEGIWAWECCIYPSIDQHANIGFQSSFPRYSPLPLIRVACLVCSRFRLSPSSQGTGVLIPLKSKCAMKNAEWGGEGERGGQRGNHWTGGVMDVVFLLLPIFFPSPPFHASFISL